MILESLTDPFSKIIVVLVCAVAALVAIFFLSIWIGYVRKARATRSWPVTTGRVLTSKVTSRRGYSRSAHANITYYVPQVIYEYTVDGTNYQGKRIAIGMDYFNRSRKPYEHIIAPYPVGAEVPVSYDPTDPQQAVLEHSVVGGWFFPILAIFIFLLLAAFILPVDRIL